MSSDHWPLVPYYVGGAVSDDQRFAERKTRLERLMILIDEMEVAQARDPMAPAELASALSTPPGIRGPKPFLGIVWGRPFGRGRARDVPIPYKDFHPEELKRFGMNEVKEALQQP